MAKQIKEAKRESVRHQFYYEFTQEELLAKGKLLSTLINDFQSLEDDFKQAKGEFKSKLDSKQAEINLTTTKVANGQEYRTDECEVEKDFDKCEKRYFYDGKLVDTVKMSATDFQTKLKLDESLKEIKDSDSKEEEEVLKVVQSAENPSGKKSKK